MAGVFELFHLSLHVKAQAELFENSSPRTREQWLREAFSKQFAFQHRNKQMYWVPSSADHDLISGNLVRLHQRRRHKPPEEGAIEEIGEEWQGAIVIIDPSHHADGQKLSFERDETIGKPRPVLQSLVAHINAMPEAPYAIEPKPIFSEESFWSWASAHEFKLKAITFEFVTPNMFDSKNAFDEDMAELGAVGVSTVKMTMSEGDRGGGIDANSSQIKNAVDYAAQGGGSLSAKARNGDKFKSTNDSAIATLPSKLADRSGGLKALTKWFPKLLGREQDNSMDGGAGDVGGPAGS